MKHSLKNHKITVSVKKTKKIITILITFLLLSTTISSIASSKNLILQNISDNFKKTIEDEKTSPIKTSSILKEKITSLRERIHSFFDRLSKLREKNSSPVSNSEKRFLRNTTSIRLNVLKNFLLLREKASPLMFYTNYSGIENEVKLRLLREVKVDVNGDGKEDIGVRLSLYPSIEKPFSLAVNFELKIVQKEGFDLLDKKAFFEAYAEVFLLGIINVKQQGDRVRFGYESPLGEEIPDSCVVTYKYIPHFLTLKKRPEHTARLDPGNITGESKLSLILGYTHNSLGKVVSEVISRTEYSPAVKTEMTIWGDGILGGSTFNFKRETQGSSKVDMNCYFNINGSVAYGYVKSLPELVTFTMDLGKNGLIEFDTHGSPPSEIGICDNLYNPVNRFYFKDLPSKAYIRWDRDLLTGKKADISVYTEGEGVSLNGHLDISDIGVFDISISSENNIDSSMELDFSKGYFVFTRSEKELSFSLTGTDVNLSILGFNASDFRLSFKVQRIDDKPFEIFLGKIVNDKIRISLASSSLTISRFKFIFESTQIIGFETDKMVFNKTGNITIILSATRDGSNVTFTVTLDVINGIQLFGFKVFFNNAWSKPRDITIDGTSTRTFEIIIEHFDFDYKVAGDLSWGYFIFRGSISYSTYREFTVNGIKGGVKGKIYMESDKNYLNISWYTVNETGYPVKKFNISGLTLGLSDFHLWFGEMVDIRIPSLTGSINVVEACNESGLLMLTFSGGGSSLDIDFSIDLTQISGFRLNMTVDDFHIDLPDTSLNMDVSWNSSNITNFSLKSDADINLSLKDMDVQLDIKNDTGKVVPAFIMENMTGYVQGHAGVDVNLTFPLNIVKEEGNNYLNLYEDKFAFIFKDVEAYIHMDVIDISIMDIDLDLGEVEFHVDVNGRLSMSILNISMCNEPKWRYPDEGLWFNWVKAVIGINASDCIFNIVSVKIENFQEVIKLLGFEVPFKIVLELNSMSINGYTDFTVKYGGFVEQPDAIPPLYMLGFRFDDVADTTITLDKLAFYLPEIALNEGAFVISATVAVQNTLLKEGSLDVLINPLGSVYQLNISEGSAIQHLKLMVEVPGYANTIFSINQSIPYLNLELNSGFNDLPEDSPYREYILIDTQNNTITADVYVRITSAFINFGIDYINQIMHTTLPHVEYDQGIKLSNVTFQADAFKIFTNITCRKRLAGYLHIFNDGEILLLVNGTEWYPISTGDGFSFTVEPGHIQMKFSTDIDVPLHIFEDYIESVTGDEITLQGDFIVELDTSALIIDILWNVSENYLKVECNQLDGRVGVENFLFEVKSDGKLKKQLRFDSLTLLNGKIILISDDGQFKIKTLKDVDLFKLINASLNLAGAHQNTLEFGIGLLKWNKKVYGGANIEWILDVDKNNDTGAFKIKIDRYVNVNTVLEIKDAYSCIKSNTGKILLGGRLRSFSLNGSRGGYQSFYFYLDWKKNEFMNVETNVNATWNATINNEWELAGSVDVKFKIHYEPPGSDGIHDLDFKVLRQGEINILQLRNTKKNLIITLGSIELEPGDLHFKICNNSEFRWANITSTLSATLSLLKIQFGNTRIDIVTISITPGETYIQWEGNTDNGYIFIDNTRGGSQSSSITTFGHIEMQQEMGELEIGDEQSSNSLDNGKFFIHWENELGDPYYQKTFHIKNSVFFTDGQLLKITYKKDLLNTSFSLLDLDSGDYENDIIIKTRWKNTSDFGCYINTDDYLYIGLIDINVTYNGIGFNMEIGEIGIKFNDFSIKYFNGNWNKSGEILWYLDITSIDITIDWENNNGEQQEITMQLCKPWPDGNPQAYQFTLDTSGCTEDVVLDFLNFEIQPVFGESSWVIDGDLVLYHNRYLTIRWDANRIPLEGEDSDTGTWHVYVDTNGESIGQISITATRYVESLGEYIGAKISLNSVQANSFLRHGTFTKIFGVWVPSGIGGDGTLSATGSIKVMKSNGDWKEVWSNGADPLTADAGGPYSGDIEESIQMHGSATGGNQPYTWLWDFGDGNTSSEQNPTHTYSQSGTYTVTLTVTDDNGDSDSDTTTAEISSNQPPVADAGGPYNGYMNEEIQFDGSNSYDPDGNIVFYQWDWGDGTTNGGPNLKYPTHSYDTPGTYTVTLTVTDDQGKTGTDTAEATVNTRWISPTGYNDPENTWDNEEKAYDDNTGTKAVFTLTGSGWNEWVWTDFLELTHSPIECSKIRFYAWYDQLHCNQIEIYVYYDDSWHPIYSGSFNNKQWVEASLDGVHTVTKAKIRFSLRRGIYQSVTADLYEFDFWLEI